MNGNTINQTRDRSAQSQRTQQSDGEADQCNFHSFYHHQAKYAGGLGAQRDAQSDFACTLGHRVGEHDVKLGTYPQQQAGSDCADMH
jgi:hypothetical protein